MKKVLALTLALALLFGIGGLGIVAAADFVMTDWDFIVLGDGTIAIAGYYGTDTDVTVPSTLDGKTVSAITYIRGTNVKSFTVPVGITSIGSGAFALNWALENIFVDSANPNYCAISGVLFNKSVTEIIAYPSAKRADTYAIPNTVKTIGDSAFHACPFISLDIPNGVETIGGSVFWDTSRLQIVRIPASVSSIGYNPFYGSSAGIELDAANAHFTLLGGVLFAKDLSKLIAYPQTLTATEYTVPNGVTTIGNGAFCRSVAETVNLPESLVTIENGAFAYSNLTSMRFTRNVQTIDCNAFNSCLKLQAYEIDASNPYFCTVDGVLFDEDVKTLINYPYGRTATSYIIPDGVTRIYSFFTYEDSGNIAMEYITIPASVDFIQHIPDWIKIYCFNLSAAHTYALNSGNLYELLDAATPQTTEIKDEDTGVNIRYNPGALLDETTMQVTGIAPNTPASVLNNMGLTVIGGFDITLMKDGAEVQPNSGQKVLVRLPNPYKGTLRYPPAIYWISDDGATMERMDVKVQGPNREYLVFWATHFSKYVMTDNNGGGTVNTAPTLTGPTAQKLLKGYVATSTVAFTLTGTPAPTVTLSNNHGGKITWDGTNKKLNIAAGLAPGEYSVTLTASNGTTPNAMVTFKLTVAKTIFSTKREATFWNWVLFFLGFGFIWMWF